MMTSKPGRIETAGELETIWCFQCIMKIFIINNGGHVRCISFLCERIQHRKYYERFAVALAH